MDIDVKDSDEVYLCLKWTGVEDHPVQDQIRKPTIGREREALGQELCTNGIANTRNKIILENGN